MIYYFDTSIFITSNNVDFPVSIVENGSFWRWILDLGKNGQIRVPEKVFEELERTDDDIFRLVRDNKDSLVEKTSCALVSLSHVLHAYGNPITEKTLQRIGADPYVIAHCHACPEDSTVVSYEITDNATAPHNKKIPSICSQVNIQHIRLPAFMWALLGAP